MLPLILIILAHSLYSLGYYVDKFLVTKTNVKESISNLMIASSFIYGLVLLPFFLFLTNFKVLINQETIILSSIAVLTSLIAIFAYYYAMKSLSSNVISVMVQLIPVFNLSISLLNGQSFSALQIIGMLLVISSSIVLSISTNLKIERKATILMIFSSFCFALFYEYFSKLSNATDFNQATVLYQIGLTLFGAILLCNKEVRKPFVDLVVKKPIFLVVNIVNKAGNMVANLLVNYVMLLMPLALVSSMIGIEPVLTVLIGWAGFKILPNYFDNSSSNKDILKLLVAILLSTTGIFLMFVF